MKNIIDIENVYYEYTLFNDEEQKEIKYQALNNINLHIKEGEFLCIIGKNGSGKSTLAKLLNGLILPTKGDVICFSLNTKDYNNSIEIKKNIGMVFQNPDNQIVASIVEEDVAFGLENICVETSEIRKRVDDSLKQMGLYKYKDFTPYKLSGGQKQRLALAGILSMKSRVIILDEPTAMLDRKARIEVIETIKKLNSEENITIILITHFMNEVLMANRVLLMDEGSIVKDENPYELFKNTDLDKYSIELPSILKIKNKLIEKGLNIPDTVFTVDDLVSVL